MHVVKDESLYPRLLADIGGTNARFALQKSRASQIENIEVLSCSDYDSLLAAILAYLSKNANFSVKFGALALPNPILGDWIQMTNHHWAFSMEKTRKALGFDILLAINDFTAQAHFIRNSTDLEMVQVGGKSCDIHSAKLVLGPGTGLGLSAIIPFGKDSYTALASEGGHVSFTPFDDIELMIFKYAKQKFTHLSAERLISGAGLSLIYEALAHKEGKKELKMSPELISSKAMDKSCSLCSLSLDIFCAILGTFCADAALTLGARGGVYICGGIVPSFVEYFKNSTFRSRFENKGRMSSYLSDIPVYVVLSKYSGIHGVPVVLDKYLKDNFTSH